MGSFPIGLVESLRSLIKQAQLYRDDASRDADKRSVMTFLLNEFFVANEESTIGDRFKEFSQRHAKSIDMAFSWPKFSFQKVFGALWDKIVLFATTYALSKITTEIIDQVTPPIIDVVAPAQTAFRPGAPSAPIHIPLSAGPMIGAGRGSATSSLRSGSTGSSGASGGVSGSASGKYHRQDRTGGPPDSSLTTRDLSYGKNNDFTEGALMLPG